MLGSLRVNLSDEHLRVGHRAVVLKVDGQPHGHIHANLRMHANLRVHSNLRVHVNLLRRHPQELNLVGLDHHGSLVSVHCNKLLLTVGVAVGLNKRLLLSWWHASIVELRLRLRLRHIRDLRLGQGRPSKDSLGLVHQLLLRQNLIHRHHV